MTTHLHLGTSGWTYDHWKGVFYPDTLARTKWFEFFAQHFDTVELNASFYKIPQLKTVEHWNEKSPPQFIYSVKMSRLVTHVRKLHNCEHELEWFFSVFQPLKNKIGIYLVQLPPSMKCKPELLRDFTALLPQDALFAFEFRNTSWYNDETVAMLKEYGHVFCIHDMGELTTPRIETAETIYVRFHGFQAQYGGAYPDEILKEWAGWISNRIKHHKTVYGYFNNDWGGFAVKNCLTLREMLRKTG